MTGTEQKRPSITLPRAMEHQRSILLSPARFKVVICGRRWGKTAIGLMATLKGHGQFRGQRKGAIDGGKIWWIAPTYKVASKIWRDLKKATRGAWVEKKEVERRIELPGGGSVTVWSADDPETLVGDGLDGVVVDEAAKVHRDAWGESIRPALADRLGWALLIGTPKGQHNWVYDVWQQAEKRNDWERWQRPTWDNPIIARSEIDEMRGDMTGAKFAQEVEAKFIGEVGDLFPREKAIFVDNAPANLRGLTRYWDKAGSERTEGDWTVGALIGELSGLFYVVDIVRGRWDPFTRNQVIEQTAELDVARWGRVSLWIEREPGNGGKESAMISARELVKFAPRFETPTKDKVMRAEHFAAAWQAGNVRIVRGPWNAHYLDELVAFPDEDMHDDQVDSSSAGFNKIVLHKPTTGKVPVSSRRSRI